MSPFSCLSQKRQEELMKGFLVGILQPVFLQPKRAMMFEIPMPWVLVGWGPIKAAV